MSRKRGNVVLPDETDDMFVLHIHVTPVTRHYIVMPRHAPIYTSVQEEPLRAQLFDKTATTRLSNASFTFVVWREHTGCRTKRQVRGGAVLSYPQALSLFVLLQDQRYQCADVSRLFLERDVECVDGLLRKDKRFGFV